MDGILNFVKTYWIVGVIAMVAVIMMVLIYSRSGTVDQLQAEIDEMRAAAESATAEAAEEPEDFDSEAHVEKIEAGTVSAEAIGKDIIKLDNELTAFYKTAEPFPEDEDERDALFKQLEDNQALNETMRGITNHGDTWQLNPDWTLELDSVVAYEATDSIPVIFTMETTDGDNAGIVHATYNVNDKSLSNITRQYTAAGLDDAASIGGY